MAVELSALPSTTVTGAEQIPVLNFSGQKAKVTTGGILAAAATDATTKSNAVQAAAATDATTKSNAAQAAAATDATTKSNAAQAAAATDATTKSNAAQAAAATDATTKSNAAQAAAISAAATDATTKTDIAGLTPLLKASMTDTDQYTVLSTTFSLKRKVAFGEMANAINERIVGPSVPEAQTLNGAEFMPFLFTDPITGATELKKVRLDAFSPTADHKAPKKPKDRNYGPHAARVIDTLSDTMLDSTTGVNASTTAGVNLNIPSTFGTPYRTTAARFGGQIDLLEDPKAIFGTKRIKLTTGKRTLGGGAALGDPAQAADYTVYRRDLLDNTYDLTGLWLRIDLECADPAAIDEMQLYLGDTSLTNFFRWNNLIGDQATRPLQFGRKTRISFPLLVAPAGDIRLGAPGYNNSVTGTPNIAAINSIQIRLLGKADAGATIQAVVYIDRLAAVEPAAPAISLCMDDGYETWYSKAKPILDRYDGVRTTLYNIRKYHDSDIVRNPLWTYYSVTLDIVGRPGNGFRLSEAQIAKFIEGGHELGFHMSGNNSAQDYSPQEVENEIIAFKKWAKEKFDYDVLTAAYPGGENGYFQGPNFVAGHGREPIEGYTDLVGYNVGLATTKSFLDGKPKKLWGDFAAHNKRTDGALYASDSEVTVRDVFSKHFAFSRSIVLNSPESDPATDSSMLRSFLYQFGPAAVPSVNTYGRAGLKSANANYGGRNTYQKDSGTLTAVASTTSVTLAASAPATQDAFADHIIAITGGTGYGQFRVVDTYSSAKVATVKKPFIPALDTTSQYQIYKSRNQFIVDSVITSGAVGIASFHDLFTSPKNFGVIATGGTASVTLAATADPTLDAYKNNWVVITKGAGVGQIRKISAYSAARVLTPSTAFSPALDTTSQYEIFISENAGTIATGGTTSVTLPATASNQDKKYVGAFIVTTGGTGTGQVRKITGHTTSRVVTVDLAFSPALDATATYEVFYNSQEVLVTNETGNALQFVYTNPFDTNSLGTQAALADLEELCRYAAKNNVQLIPLREAFTRSI
jgi:peptidoglycan/xylan/chitin deacetylase (PgdA/CDA1 family)